MEAISGTARSYLDFAGLADLRARAQNEERAATLDAARQFEAMFMQMMLQSMRAAVVKSDLLESATLDTYESMFDRELALALAARGGIGLADQIVAQLERTNQPASAASVLDTRRAMALDNVAAPHSLQAEQPAAARALAAPRALDAAPYDLRGYPLRHGSAAAPATDIGSRP